MKKIIFIFILLLSLSSPGWSQLSYQVQAGVSLVDMATVNRPEIDGMIFNDDDKLAWVSYLVGFNAQYDLKLFYVKTGLVYSRRGMTQEINEKEAVNLHYLGVPFLIGRKIIKNFSIEAGPEINFLVHQKYDDNFEDIDVGFQLGTVYKLMERIDLRFHYYHGLTNASVLIKKDPKHNDMKLQNRMIALSVGYRL